MVSRLPGALQTGTGLVVHVIHPEGCKHGLSRGLVTRNHAYKEVERTSRSLTGILMAAVVPISKAYSNPHFTLSQEHAGIWEVVLADMIKMTDGVYLSTESLYLIQGNPDNWKHSS